VRGRWLVGSIVAVLVAAIFVSLGLWQLGRHHHKHDKVRAERAAYAAPAPAFETTAPKTGTRVEVSGTYDRDAAHETLLRDQLHGGNAGVDVLTPVLLADGTAVVVDRGWVATGDDVSAPPAGPVIVRGVVHEPRSNSTQSPVERDGARLSVARVDLDRIGRDLPYRLQHVWVEAQYQQPSPARGDPQLPEPPQPDQVNHLQYAIQWFAFALIPLIGWPIVVWRRGRRRVTR
jgi:cytochrome oxidase assembly protein ShyY1